MPRLDDFEVEPVVTAEFLEGARAAVAEVRLSDEVMDFVVDVVRATREDASLLFGASPRSSNMLAVASRALALLDGREYVIPDDVKRLALPVLGHRVVLAPDAHIEGVNAATVVRRILEKVPAPR